MNTAKQNLILDLYYSGKNHAAIIKETGLDHRYVSNVITNSFITPKDIKERLEQLTSIERRLFFLIDKELATGVKNKAVDELKHTYSKFLLL